MKLRHTEIGLPAGDVWLDGQLAHSPAVPGLVIFVERSSHRLSAGRGAVIASTLQEVGFATLKIALLSRDDERHAPDLWNQIPVLTQRIASVVTWVQHQPALKTLPLGIVSRDTAAAAMVRLASRADSPFRALVSRSGRPDLAGAEPLRALAIPTLLVAGELDPEAVQTNRQAAAELDCPHKLAIVAGAGHDFREPGTLDEATQQIIDWLVRWLASARPLPTPASRTPQRA